MTIMHIQIPDDLKEAFENAFPGETIEAAVERLLRAEVARQRPALPPRAQALLEAFDRIREKTTPISNDEIRRLRHEGRP